MTLRRKSSLFRRSKVEGKSAAIAPPVKTAKMTTINPEVTRPSFSGACFVQNFSYFIKVVHVCIECLLFFLWRDVSDDAVQAFGVVPVDQF